MKNDIIINIPDYEGIGVYSLTNNENGKIYIGSSINVKARILLHLYSFHSLNCNPKFIQDLHNNNTFSAQIVEKFSYGISEYELRNKEFFYIKKYDSLKNGYNCTPSSYLDPKLKHAYIMPPQQQKSKLKRIPLDVQKEKYEEIKSAAERSGESVNGYIKKAIDERMEREQ